MGWVGEVIERKSTVATNIRSWLPWSLTLKIGRELKQGLEGQP
jgi:hypothetical protein